MTSPSQFASRGLLFPLLFSGCAFGPRAPFTPVPPPPTSAAIYFYRPSEMSGRLIRPKLTANDVEIGKLANDSYGVAYFPPGEVRLRSDWPGIPGTTRNDAVSVNVEAGKSYYVRVRYRVSKARELTPSAPMIGGLSFENRVGLEEVQESEAVPQLAGLAAVPFVYGASSSPLTSP